MFLCKIVDEDRKPTEELKFQWLDSDTDEELQKRLSDLYKQGMKEYLTKEVTDYNDEQVEEKLYALEPEIRDQIKDMFTRVRLHKNNEFAFKEVFDEKSFRDNAFVVREVVELLQPYQIRYGHKQQFLGDFFELLLSTGIKQEAGQFFTPVPIAKFIISSLPIRELIEHKINNDETNFLPYIIDYAAGSGHFLTEAMDEVQKIIETIDPNKQRPSVKAKLKSWRESSFDWAYDYVYGIEADYRLVKTAKVSCFLNGDGLANVIHADGLDHFQKSIDYKGKLKEVSQEDEKDNGQFDILIANPPYSVSAFKNSLKYGEESFELYNRLTDDSSEIECLFIERMKQLLKPGGWAGVILPSSIMSNSGVYTDAREIILKYFDLKAIAEFGSNTFMATGTNTVTLFLERKNNNEWKKIESAIKNFFDRPKDATLNGIEKAFSKYVSEVFDDIELSDYITLINKKPNENIQKQELYNQYKAWFSSLTEISQLKEKKVFKDKSKDEQELELEKLFYEKVFFREQDKMLYFFLICPQQTVLIKVGEKQAEKDFIGYEFSNRRGHEGIKMYRDENGNITTKLYDNQNHLNATKANSYVYSAFLRQKFSIVESLAENIACFDTLELIDFKKFTFEKAISLGAKKKVQISSKWDLVKLGEICDIKIGGTPSRNESSYYINGNNLWVSISEMDGNVINNTKEKITDIAIQRSNVKLIKAGTTLVSFKLSIGKTAIAGRDLYTNEAIAALETFDNKVVCDKYLFILFNARYINLDKDNNNAFGKSLNIKMLKEVKIPLPPKEIQERIIEEINIIEQTEKSDREKSDILKNKITDIINTIINLNYPIKRLGELSTLITKGSSPAWQGINYTLNKEVLFITSENVREGFLDLNKRKYLEKRFNDIQKRSILQSDDVLINIVGASIGRAALFNISEVANINQAVALVRCNQELLFPKFLNHILNSDYAKHLYNSMKKEVARANLSLQNIADLKIPLPCTTEQKRIISEFEQLEKEILAIKNNLLNIVRTKEKILEKYLL